MLLMLALTAVEVCVLVTLAAAAIIILLAMPSSSPAIVERTVEGCIVPSVNEMAPTHTYVEISISDQGIATLTRCNMMLDETRLIIPKLSVSIKRDSIELTEQELHHNENADNKASACIRYVLGELPRGSTTVIYRTEALNTLHTRFNFSVRPNSFISRRLT